MCSVWQSDPHMGRQNVHRLYKAKYYRAPTEMLQFSHLIAVYTIDRVSHVACSVISFSAATPTTYTNCSLMSLCDMANPAVTASGQLGQYIYDSRSSVIFA